MAYPQTFDDIRTAVIAKARLDAVADKTKAGVWVNKAYFKAATETRCFQTSRTDVLTAAAAFSLNSAVHEIELFTCTAAGSSAWFPLKEATLDEILNLRATSQAGSGTPRRYALVGLTDIELWPTPAGGETLTTWYANLPAALSADGDIPLIPEPHASDLLEFGALIHAAEFKRDLMMLGDFQQQYATALAGFQRYVNRKAGAYPASFPTWTRGRGYGPHDPSTDVPYFDQIAG